MEPITAYLGLGANLGDRESNLSKALRLLAESPGIWVVKCSSLYETAPWGVTNQPDFLNCVAEIRTDLLPVTLLKLVKKVEQSLGRQENFRYGPRVIDIDILLYGDQVIQVADPDLQIPHVGMSERAFVLVPLAEIAPETLHPTSAVSVQVLCNQVAGKSDVRLWGPPLKFPQNG